MMRNVQNIIKRCFGTTAIASSWSRERRQISTTQPTFTTLSRRPLPIGTTRKEEIAAVSVPISQSRSEISSIDPMSTRARTADHRRRFTDFVHRCPRELPDPPRASRRPHGEINT